MTESCRPTTGMGSWTTPPATLAGAAPPCSSPRHGSGSSTPPWSGAPFTAQTARQL